MLGTHGTQPPNLPNWVGWKKDEVKTQHGSWERDRKSEQVEEKDVKERRSPGNPWTSGLDNWVLSLSQAPEQRSSVQLCCISNMKRAREASQQWQGLSPSEAYSELYAIFLYPHNNPTTMTPSYSKLQCCKKKKKTKAKKVINDSPKVMWFLKVCEPSKNGVLGFFFFGGWRDCLGVFWNRVLLHNPDCPQIFQSSCLSAPAGTTAPAFQQCFLSGQEFGFIKGFFHTKSHFLLSTWVILLSVKILPRLAEQLKW
jgi:hypothetical protein